MGNSVDKRGDKRDTPTSSGTYRGHTGTNQLGGFVPVFEGVMLQSLEVTIEPPILDSEPVSISSILAGFKSESEPIFAHSID